MEGDTTRRGQRPRSYYNHLHDFGGVGMHFLLLYDFVPDYLQRRAAFRGAHLRLAWEAQQRGELISLDAVRRRVKSLA